MVSEKPSAPDRLSLTRSIKLFIFFFCLYVIPIALNPRPFVAIGIFGSDDMQRAYDWHPQHSFIAKHPLFVVAMVLYQLVRHILFAAPPVFAHNLAVVFPMAVLGAAAVWIAYYVFLENSYEREKALPFTILYGFSSATWLYSSLPEAYALIAVSSNLVLLSLLRSRTDAPRELNRTALLNALSCFASPQQIFLSIIPGLRLAMNFPLLAAVRKAARYAIVFALAFLVPYQIYLKLTGMGWRFGPVYLNVYAHPSNLLNIHWSTVIALSFLVYSVVAPEVNPHLFTDPTLSIFRAVSWPWLFLCGLYVAFCAVSLLGLYGRLSKKRAMAVPLAGYLIAYLAFFLYFNPAEAYLYVFPAVLPWLLILQDGFCAGWNRARRVGIWVLIAAVGLNSLYFRLFLMGLK